MTTRARDGSILLFCIALVAALAVLAYGFVRVAQLHRHSGDSSNLHLLAREAAVTGTNHAIEQILRDHSREPFTRVDGPAIRAFSTHDLPYAWSNSNSSMEISGTTGGAIGINRDDMPASDAFDVLQLTYFNGSAMERPIKEGYMASPGRGRFYEPEFYNLAPATPVAFDPLVTAPTAPVRFGTSYATAPLPDRSDGNFYDERLRRIPGDPRLARNKARYRLRYAVVTADLEGQLLVNGDQGVDYTAIATPDPRAVADPAVARMVRNMHKLPAIVDAHEIFGHGEANIRLMRGGPTAGVAAEHVFIGRGSTANADSRRSSNSAPTTFPLMYRKQDGPIQFMGAWSSPDGGWPGASLYSTATGTVQGASLGGEAIPTSTGRFLHMLIGPQFTFSNWMHATYGNATESVNERGQACFDRYTPFGRGMSAVGAGEPLSRYCGHVDTPWCVNLATVTPRLFYAMVAAYMPPGGIALRYSTQSDVYYLAGAHGIGATTITLRDATGLTAGTTLTIIGNPYVVLTVDHTTQQITVGTGLLAPAPLLAAPNAGMAALDGTQAAGPSAANTHYAATRTRDFFVNSLSPAFARYQAPQRVADAVNPLIQPDYHVDDFWQVSGTPNTVYRGPDARYPGKLAFNGFDPSVVHARNGSTTDLVGKWQHDALGYYLRSQPTNPATTDGTGRQIAVKPRPTSQDERAPQAAWPFWLSQDNGRAGHANDSNSGITPTDTMLGNPKPAKVGPHPDSIWEVVGQAMAATASMVQGQAFRYATCNGSTLGRYPERWFDNAAWSGPSATTIRDVDALFVANLGSNFAKPNDPTPVKAWYGNTSGWIGLKSFTPEWNLAKLRTAKASASATYDLFFLNDPAEPGYVAPPAVPTYTAVERTQAAELIINDVRLSFFGANPQYGDAFRALDLNGDGKAACSGFPSNGSATPREVDLAIDQYTTNVDLDGIATEPVATYFSNTGCFALSRSRFWHITVRGEVWDNVANMTVDRAQLETVLCVDPAGVTNDLAAPALQDPGGGQYSTHVIYQSWVLDGLREFLPRRF